MNEIKLSIIIPVYNAGKYIYECLSSILKNNRRDYEVICIDDGSKDNSKDIIFSINDDRVSYIYKNNEGVSKARNIGIDLAKGDYISFVDSDDYVDEAYVDVIMENIKKYPDRLIIFNHQNLGDSSIVEKHSESNEDLYRLACEQTYNAPWDKVFKKSIIDDKKIKFDSYMKTSEDGVFFLEYLYFINSFIVIKKPLYNYRTNPLGAVSNPQISYIMDQRRMLDKIVEFSKVKNINLKYTRTFDVAIERMYYLIVNLINANVPINTIDKALSKSSFLNTIDISSLQIKGKVKYALLKLKAYKIMPYTMR